MVWFAGGFPAANGVGGGDMGFSTPGQGLRTQSMGSIPMGPPPSLEGSSSSPAGAGFASPPQYAGPPGPPVFTSPARATPADYNPQNREPSNFAEIPLARALAPQSTNGHSTALAGGHHHRSEEEFDAYSLSASAPFVLFSAQKVLAFFTIFISYLGFDTPLTLHH